MMPYRYPPNLVFMIQFSPETDPDRGRLTGRVEHIESGQNCHFTSSQELDEFMKDVLRSLIESSEPVTLLNGRNES